MPGSDKAPASPASAPSAVASAEKPVDEAASGKPGDRIARLPGDASREALMVRAAKLFFRLGRTQTDIATELGLTRWQVSRLLDEARELGIVTIEIRPLRQRLPELEAALQARFGLRDAVVVRQGTGTWTEAPSEAQATDAVTRAAADYLSSLLPRPELIGISWGRTMAAVARNLAYGWAPEAHVVQLNGAVALRSGLDGANSVAEAFARTAPGTATIFPAPAILGAALSRQVLEEDRVIADVLALAARAQVLLFTFGAADHRSVHIASGYVDSERMAVLQARGAVGDILGRFVTARGTIADPELDARTLGLRLEQLRGRQASIGVVAGASKHAVTLAALRAGYVNVLITDEATARHALEAIDV